MGLSPSDNTPKTMPEFAYTARDKTGRQVTGTINATGQREAMAVLSSRALYPTDLQSHEPSGSRVRMGRGRVPRQKLATTYAQMADLLQSGVPLLRTLAVLREQTAHARLRHVLGEVHQRVEDGSTLAEAMARYQDVFGEMAVSMVRAGGEGGFLEEALARVAEFTDASEDLRKRTVGAMVYPLFLLAFGVVVVTVLLVFFVPKFDELFARLRERNELPAPTEWLLATSSFVQSFGIFILAGLVAAGWFARRWLATEDGRLWWDRVKLRLPMAGGVFLSLAVARFCRVLGTLLRNGVPILRSLEISSDATGNRILGAAIADATENISAGQPLAEPLAASGQFPPTVMEMIAVAEQANNLENVLIQVADSLERNTWRRLDLLVRMLEPVMLLILAGVVLLVVVALLLPVLKMGTTV